jgi:hypothetical protein
VLSLIYAAHYRESWSCIRQKKKEEKEKEEKEEKEEKVEQVEKKVESATVTVDIEQSPPNISQQQSPTIGNSAA